MGIDIYLEWDGQEEERKAAQGDKPNLWSTTEGHVGYLREAYHGGPYATKILVREAFESETCKAAIPAAVMRARLTEVSAAADGCDGGHNVAAMIMGMLAATGANVVSTPVQSGATQAMSVEDAVRTRCKNVYNSDDEEIEAVVQSFRDFVELAERKEAEHGKPCVVYASY
jgi:hypothetical protein